jgi:Fe-S cluster assembly ATP-binding protein
MLRIRNLSTSIDGKDILRGLNLDVRAGEVHAIMGPNGSGKSTFAQVLAGRDIYKVVADELSFDGRDVLGMPPEMRAREGIFLAFQYPVEIPGVSNLYFLRAAVNAVRGHRGLPELDAVDFMSLAREQAKSLGIDDAMLKRSLNEGFSGGEKKRNEILQLKLLEPRLAILDESDSGLDIDALRVVADGINAMRSPDRAIIAVTHYQRLLSYVVPDRVHVLLGGRIVRSGGKDLAMELEKKGYGWLEQKHERSECKPDRAQPSRDERSECKPDRAQPSREVAS